MVKSTAELKTILSTLINCLKEKGVQVNRLYLYGFYANGKPMPSYPQALPSAASPRRAEGSQDMPSSLRFVRVCAL